MKTKGFPKFGFVARCANFVYLFLIIGRYIITCFQWNDIRLTYVLRTSSNVNDNENEQFPSSLCKYIYTLLISSRYIIITTFLIGFYQWIIFGLEVNRKNRQ